MQIPANGTRAIFAASSELWRRRWRHPPLIGPLEKALTLRTEAPFQANPPLRLPKPTL